MASPNHKNRNSSYAKDSLTLAGTVMMGTGVMIGAGIFALTGQMAQMTGALFPLAFLAAAVVVGFAVASNLSLAEIIQTKDYSLAAAARPALGSYRELRP